MPRKNEPAERQCAVTREVRSVGSLIRFVLGPEGQVVPDLKRSLPGRGVWVTGTKEAVAAAGKNGQKVFGRGFKSEVRVEPGLPELVDGLLERAALQALSMSRKAGELVTGFAKVDAALRQGEVVGLIHASDASEDGVRKLASAAAGQNDFANGIEIVRLFDSDQLDLALGRSNVIHAALLAGQASENFLTRARDLERFRKLPAVGDDNGDAVEGVAQD